MSSVCWKHDSTAGKFSHEKSKTCLYLNDAKAPLFQSPSDHFFKLPGCVDIADLSTPPSGRLTPAGSSRASPGPGRSHCPTLELLLTTANAVYPWWCPDADFSREKIPDDVKSAAYSPQVLVVPWASTSVSQVASSLHLDADP
ncbi:hypothetical protein CVT26_011858 [Gymnopilus dilepis]|uniref:Uncharacterized protein n=1 Tax=Gymnopilus dilepis TaxID=231916 RepID=A0A409WJY0_9AGAR|nr:hypothetical protein CVT26_011858 [Gymnopilus dilepis]